jgi:DNA primase
MKCREKPRASDNGKNTLSVDFAQQLKSSIDIVRVIQDYVRLKKVGSRYSGLCPFHNEKTPSFTVTPALQFYYCHGCHAGGDIFTFIQQMEHVSFLEARNLLAERNGIPLPKKTEFADDDTKLRAALYAMHELAQEEFQSQLAGPTGAEARAYLSKRGVSAEMAEHFGLGYAGKGLAKLLDARGFSRQQIDASGLVGRREDGSLYELFRNRLMFPIHNESGKIIGFGGRALDPNEKAKYINSPETAIYKKKATLYNMHRAKEAIRKADRVILVEGYMDVIGVYASGMHEVIATCGTALTREQILNFRRHSQRIVLNFDPDNAGSNAAEKSIQLLLAESMHIRIVQLAGGLDPDEYCKQHGPEAYAQAVERAQTYFYWLADRARMKFDMRSAEGRVEAFQYLLPAIHGLSDKLERVAVANDLAAYLHIDTGLVLENFRKMAADKRGTAPAPAPERLGANDRMLISLLLASEEARHEFVPELQKMAVVQESPARKIFEALFTMHNAGADIQFGDLHARLDEAGQKMLAATLMGTGSGDAEVTVEHGRRCLEALRELNNRLGPAEIKMKIREAERSGNIVEALRLAQLLKR